MPDPDDAGQLNPHFLYKTLDTSVAGKIPRSPGGHHLRDLADTWQQHTNDEFFPLEQELPAAGPLCGDPALPLLRHLPARTQVDDACGCAGAK
jgi:hypothetical protein